MKVRGYWAKLKRMWVAAWAMAKARVWTLEMVREKTTKSDRLGDIVCAMKKALVCAMEVVQA